ncbi:MAG: nicotinamide mononucleotide transporter [Oscillospiraceae bacterium]|nr:nicotinamide mononucleotide transporter [Oscillospiraceae bacterium]
MNIKQAFAGLTVFERSLWLVGMALIAGSFWLCGSGDVLVLVASLLGATALIFLARGEPLGQVLVIIFSLLYGYISLRQRYYGELITYVGMTAPMAVISLAAWLRHPYRPGESQVTVSSVSRRSALVLVVLTGLVTWGFYYILRAFDTPNLALSTLSVATSFFAVGLTVVRSPLYALAYAGNDLVLIGLWALASRQDLTQLPMVACFLIFFVNDGYGFVNWRKMKRLQSRG